MSRKALLNLSLVGLVIALSIGLGAVTNYYAHLPERLSQHETLVFGQNRLVPGSQTALRVMVRDSRDGAPLQAAQIKVSLQPANGGPALSLFNGATNTGGTADVAFKVPEDAAPNQVLVIETTSKLGSDRVERPVTLQRDYRVLLTTDKPIYQPGQTIHLRALALSTFDLKPASAQPLEMTIADGKGNKVFRQQLTTSSYGAASADFQLASQVNGGAYKISAVLDGVTSEKTVTVESYVLPKFAVKLETDKSYYLPGQHVSGKLNAAYFFGKPVSKSDVTLSGFTFDVQRTGFPDPAGRHG